jgi:hypothetical protein
LNDWIQTLEILDHPFHGMSLKQRAISLREA